MSEKGQEESSNNSTAQPVHLYPPHRPIPPTSVAPPVLPFVDRHDASSPFVTRSNHHFSPSTFQ